MKTHVRVGRGLLVLALVVGMLVSAFGAAPASANPAPPAAPLANALRISQVYGGGGATTGSPTYKCGCVGLFNASHS